MDELTKAYARMEDGKNGFYKALVEIGVDDKETGKMRTQEWQKFEGRMFGQWRESVAGMTQEEFLEARQAGTLGDDFRLLHNFVKKHPECRTNRELREKIGRLMIRACQTHCLMRWGLMVGARRSRDGRMSSRVM